MENNIFEKWDKGTDLKGLKADIKERESKATSNGQFVEVEDGEYEVKIIDAKLQPTKTTGDPMVAIKFEIIAGENKGKVIYMNQVVTQGFQLNLMNEFFKSLETSVLVEFDTYKQYSDMILDIVEECVSEGYEYALLKETNEKGYKSFRITDTF